MGRMGPNNAVGASHEGFPGKRARSSRIVAYSQSRGLSRRVARRITRNLARSGGDLIQCPGPVLLRLHLKGSRGAGASRSSSATTLSEFSVFSFLWLREFVP